MSIDYQVGDLSTLLQSTSKPSKKKKCKNDERLVSLFSVKSVNSQIETDKRKAKKRNKENSVMKKPKDKSDINTHKEVVVDSGIAGKTEKSLSDGPAKKKKKLSKKLKDLQVKSQSPGFNPPAGIVHESLVNSLKKKNKKRKAPSSDSENETPSKRQRPDDEAVKKKLTRPRRDKMAKATDNRTVFVGNLPLTVKKKKLMNLLKEYGTIESIRYRCFAPKDPNMKKRVIAITQNVHPDRHNCVAYVKFTTPESAKRAMKCNGKQLDGFHLRVDMAARDQVRDIKKSIFVGNLPFDIEEEKVRRHFEDCGIVNNVRIVRDAKTSLGKGFCYVSFDDADAVAFALRLNGSRFAGREVRVMQCLPNPKKSALDKKTNKPDKMKSQSKRGIKPSNKEAEPFHIIEAGQEREMSKQTSDGEEPKKMNFAEKFEKKKQKRIEEGKKLKKMNKKQEKEANLNTDASTEKAFSPNKNKNKDKTGFRKHKKSKFKKSDSRTGRGKSSLFIKSTKTNRTKTFSNKTSVSGDHRHNAKHKEFNESGYGKRVKTAAHHTPKVPKHSGVVRNTNETKTTPKHTYFD